MIPTIFENVLNGRTLQDYDVEPIIDEPFPLWQTGGGVEGWLPGLFLGVMFVFTMDLLGMLIFGAQRRSRWFLVRSLTNAATLYFAQPDLLLTFADPTSALTSRKICSVMPVCLTCASHLYHFLAYLPAVTVADLFHHLITLLLFYPLLFLHYGSPLINSAHVFLLGCPGGVDYLLAALVKLQLLSPAFQSRCNRLLNHWVRIPGMLYHSAFGYIQACFLSATMIQFSTLQWISTFILAVGSIPTIGTLFFTQQLVSPHDDYIFF